MFTPMVLAQLKATRAACEATIAQIDGLIAFSEEVMKQQAMATLPPEDTGACTHPPEMRRSAPAMGRISRQICGVCRQEVA